MYGLDLWNKVRILFYLMIMGFEDLAGLSGNWVDLAIRKGMVRGCGGLWRFV